MLTIKTPLSLNSWLPSHQLLLSGKLQYCKPDPTLWLRILHSAFEYANFFRDEGLVAKPKVKNKDLTPFFSTFWMNLQLRWDLYRAREAEGKYLRSIKKIKAAHIRV